jgi:hypothetical protein
MLRIATHGRGDGRTTAMTTERLTHLAKRNNLVQGCAGIVGLCCSAALWYASFWFFRGIALL